MKNQAKDQGLHEPVLVQEVMSVLCPAPGQVIVDATLGHAGHSLEILLRMGDEGLLVGMERDPWMLAAARQRIEAAQIPCSRWRLVEADHAQMLPVLAEVLADVDPPAPDGILMDLGPSTPQLLNPDRGMSWESDASLDMRMRPVGDTPTAAQIVNTWSEAELARLIRENSDEKWAVRIAKKIVEARERAPIQTGRQLGEIIGGAIPRKAWPPKTHPATRTFLALRIEVNSEYRTLEDILPKAFEILKPMGRLVVITFHSGEDRRVKQFMREMTTPPQAPWPLPQTGQPAPARLLTPKPLVASEQEVARNPRSRSAKVRAIQKNPV